MLVVLFDFLFGGGATAAVVSKEETRKPERSERDESAKCFCR